MFYQHLSTTVYVIVIGDAPTDWVRPNMFRGSRSTMLKDSILDLYELKEPPINICRVSLMVVPTWNSRLGLVSSTTLSGRMRKVY